MRKYSAKKMASSVGVLMRTVSKYPELEAGIQYDVQGGVIPKLSLFIKWCKSQVLPTTSLSY